jgi:hypothetical protein
VFDSLRLIVFAVLALVFGTVMFVAWLPRLADMRHPVVEGKVVDRTPIKPWGIARVDFTIELANDPATKVHAFTQRYLMDKLPQRVRFHYSGDPSYEVVLHEHEENPLWVALCCWAIGAVLGFLAFAFRRRMPTARAPNWRGLRDAGTKEVNT